MIIAGFKLKNLSEKISLDQHEELTGMHEEDWQIEDKSLSKLIPGILACKSL